MASAQTQMGNLAQVDAHELGEVIDMIKDLEEAIYYCTITKSMEESKEKDSNMSQPISYYSERVIYPQDRDSRYYPIKDNYYYPERDMDRQNGRMYYDNSVDGTSASNTSTAGVRHYTEVKSGRDDREGRSPMTRKMYMEGKEKHQDKTYQLKELEKYMTELSQDLVEMIKDSSPEEKQYLEKRISQLATKINNV